MAFTLETLIIGLVRVAGSLPVLRWAFAGALIAILVDFSDLFQKNLLRLGGLGDYQQFDKWADLVYMVTFLIVALRWNGVVRNIAIALFGFRIIGMTAFEITSSRAVLIAFPNLFEFWFVFVSALKHWWPDYRLTRNRLTGWLLLLLALKMFQEYALHGAKWLDKYTAIGVVESWWDFLTGWT
ncbi:MAG: hypothetical protein IIB27_07280 [Chloroflexi bacterium]|nr:hypothetical protein [Chloroflexota bacterium]